MSHSWFLRTCLVLVAGAFAANASWAQSAGPLKAKIGVGGSSTQIALMAMNVARTKGFFKEEGVDVEVIDFGSGAKGLQALVGRNVDMNIGVYEHAIRMHAKGQDIRSIVLHSSAPGIVVALTTKMASKYTGVKDLKGAKIGVSAPGSATHLLLNQLLVRNGLKPDDVAVIGIGNAAGAVAAVRTGGELDAIVNYDPVISELEQKGEIKVILDTRTVEGARAFFGSDFAFLTTYAHADYIAKNPAVVQAVVSATVRALVWMRTAKAEDILAAIPEEYWRAQRDLYLSTIRKGVGGFSANGMLTAEAAKTVYEGLLSYDAEVKGAKIDLSKTYDNQFAVKANQKYGAK